MSLALAATWNPRGELPRLERLLPQLRRVYLGMVVVVRPGAGQEILGTLQDFGRGGTRVDPGLSDPERDRSGAPGYPPVLHASLASDWSWGRHLALQGALEIPAGHVQYADLDRLLRWVETRPEEWRAAAEWIQEADCLVIGRTEAAYRTHPQALVCTEEISNQVVSYLVGRPMDFSAGSKGFSRRAAEFLVANSRPGRALGTDAEWPVLLHRAGFAIDYVAVDGLDWEIPDQHQPQAAGAEQQARQAAAYDADPQNWARRAAVALEIVQSALDTARQEIRFPNDV